MANEFVTRKGLISSGSINVSGSVTASYFKGDGSQLTNLPAATVLSSSVSIDTYNFNGDGTTKIYLLSQSYNVNSLEVFVDGLAQANVIDYTLASATLTFVDTPPSASNILIKAFVNVTQNLTGSFSGSFFGSITSASYATTASAATSITFTPSTASYALTASYVANAVVGSGVVSSSTQFKTLTDPFTGSFTGSLVGTADLTTLTLRANQVSAGTLTYNAGGYIGTSAGIGIRSDNGSFYGAGSINNGYINIGTYATTLYATGAPNANTNTFTISAGAATPNIAGYVNNSIYAPVSVSSAAPLTQRGLYTTINDTSTGIANTLYGIYADVSLGTNTSASRYAAAFMGGNVGIGTSTPSATLHVQGNISASAFTGSILSPGVVSSSAQYPGWVTSSAQINTGSFTGSFSGSFFSQTSGPALVVSGSITGSSTSASIDINQVWNTSGQPTAIKLNVTDVTSSATSLLMDLQVGGSSKVKVDKTGRLYISPSPAGIISISNPFQIYADSGIYFGNSQADASLGSFFSTGWQMRSTHLFGWTAGSINSYGQLDTILARDSAGIIAQRTGSNAQTFRIYNTYTDASNYERGKLEWSSNVFNIGTENAGTGVARAVALQTNGTERVRIDTSGNVGIGTTSPNAKLDVNGNVIVTGSLTATTALYTSLLQETQNNGLQLYVPYNSIKPNLTIWGGTGAVLNFDTSLRAVYPNTGSGWDIGTTAKPLGNAYFSGSVNVQGNTSGSTATYTGNVTVQSLTETSTAKLKNNITPIESVNINTLNPVRFNWKDTGKEDIGLIAEEVAELFPELVEFNEAGEPVGVHYTKLTILLLKTVQELKKQIDGNTK